MICPNCGADNPEQGKFCKSCGQMLSPVFVPEPEASPRSRRLTAVLSAVILLLLAVAVAGIFLLLGKHDDLDGVDLENPGSMIEEITQTETTTLPTTTTTTTTTITTTETTTTAAQTKTTTTTAETTKQKTTQTQTVPPETTAVTTTTAPAPPFDYLEAPDIQMWTLNGEIGTIGYIGVSFADFSETELYLMLNNEEVYRNSDHPYWIQKSKDQKLQKSEAFEYYMKTDIELNNFVQHLDLLLRDIMKYYPSDPELSEVYYNLEYTNTYGLREYPDFVIPYRIIVDKVVLAAQTYPEYFATATE